MNTKAIIIIPTLGQVLPKAFMEKVWAEFPTYFGAVTRTEEGGKAELMQSGDTELPDLAGFLKQIEEDKNFPMMLQFVKAEQQLTTESQQPFVLLRNESNQPLVCGFMLGNYNFKTSAEDQKSPHTDEYFAHEKMLGPQLRRIFTKQCGGDLEKFEKELLEQDTIDLVNGFAGDRGLVTLLSVSGNIYKFSKGIDIPDDKFPWAYVSDDLGFVEQSSQTYQPMEEPKKPELAPTGKGNRFGKAKAAVTAVIASVTPVNTTIAQENKTDTKLPDHSGRPMISCPQAIREKGKNKYTEWYEANTINIGLTKDQMKNGVAAPANDDYIAKHSGKSLKETMEHFKDKIEQSKAVPSKAVPIISPRAKHVLNEFLNSGEIKAIIEKGRILNADELKAPPEVAPWSQQMGRDLMEVYRWDREVIDGMLKKCETEKDYMPAILLIEELVRENMKLLLDGPKTTDTKAEDEIKPPPTNNEGSTIKPVEPEVKPESKPASTNKFNRFGKKAA